MKCIVKYKAFNLGQAAPAATASPEALEQLLTMGFDEDSARVALVQSRNNVQQALSLLL